MSGSTRRSSVRDLAQIAVFAGIVAALGLIPPVFLPIGQGIPVTAQSLGVMLAGLILGARRGFFALLLFVALVALGLPLLSGGRGGLAVFVGFSAGFVIGFPIAAYAVGWFTERFCRDGRYRLGWGIVAALLGGVGVLYVFGALGFMIVTRLSPLPVLIFIPGDLLKAVIAALVAKGVHAAYPGLLPVARRSEPTPVS
ncbi:biotin transporter BioY [Microlunatus ginsengisoli]|uniref:Biotin transporter n=1 Tax=Microlunatus ginsengisoli TaxID=363863 RepID=A0ABP6ZFY3_9ACTN